MRKTPFNTNTDSIKAEIAALKREIAELRLQVLEMREKLEDLERKEEPVVNQVVRKLCAGHQQDGKVTMSCGKIKF